VADLVAELTKRLKDIGAGQAIPHTLGSGAPARAHLTVRIRPADYRGLLDRVSRSSGGEHWLKATITDRATDAGGYCLVNPLVAVRGRQTIGSFWYYPMMEVRADPERLLTEALTGWRRWRLRGVAA